MYTKGKSKITLKIENANGPEKPWIEFRCWVFSQQDRTGRDGILTPSRA